MSASAVNTSKLVADLEALERLIEEHRLLKETIEHSPLPYCVYDQDDRLIAWNEAYEGIHPDAFQTSRANGEGTALTYDELVRRQLFNQVPSDQLEQAVADRVKAQRLADGRPVERYYDEQGWLRVTKYSTPSGAIAGIAVDINELKAREEDLRVAWKAAEAGEKAKAEFLANMSHEIRTPMNGVIGMAELMGQMELTDRQRMFNDVIIKSGHALLNVINDVLDFSKIEAGQMQLDPASFDLADTVQTAAALFSAQIASKGLELVVRVQPGLPDAVIGDSGRLRQVLMNLVGNAAKFTENGHIYVNLEADAIAPDDDGSSITILLQVEDTGTGIPADKREAVFAKFTQVDGSVRRKHEGTGLGLSIAASLVDLMGGEIGVDSRDGLGSTFWIRVTFPIDGTAHPHRQATPAEISGARVLVIDDNRVNRMILSEQLAAWNLRPTTCASGRKGLAELASASDLCDPYELIVLDHQMPEMSGEDVLLAVRENIALKDLPVIFLTSVDCALAATTMSRSNISASLTKPVRPDDLLGAICKSLFERNCPEPHAHEMAPTTGVDHVSERGTVQRTDGFADTQPDVLVAEDNEVGQIVIREVLEGAGYSVRIVNNGKLAVSAHKLYRPKIILMDVAMPELSGTEATKLIRIAELNQAHRTPIIGVTAHALSGDRELCLAAGMDDYLTKPISTEDVIATVERWIVKFGGVRISD